MTTGALAVLISDSSSVPDEEGDCISTHQAQWQQEATGSSLTAGIKDWKEKKDFYSSPLPQTLKELWISIKRV